jgi:hypothetical protein
MSDAVVVIPFVPTQANYNILVNTNGVIEVLTMVVVPNREYFLTGAGGSVILSDNLIMELEFTLNLNTAGGVYTVTMLPTGRLRIVCSLPYQIIWDDVLTDQTIVSYFGQVGPNPPALAVTSDSIQTCRTWWVPDRAMYRTNWNAPKVIGRGEQSLAGVPFGYQLGSTADGKFTWLYIGKERTLSRFAVADGDPYNSFETIWLEGLTKYRSFVVHENPALSQWLVNNPFSNRYRLIDLEEHPEPWKLEEALRNTTFTIELVGVKES